MPKLTWQCNPRVERFVASLPPGAVILDLGAGGRRIAPRVKTVDLVAAPGTDIVADVCSLPLPDGSADAVIATGLLEHLEDDGRFLAEANRILRPGGSIYVEVPFLQQYHEDPVDVRRYTQPGLALRLGQAGFAPLESGFHIGPTVAMITLASYYAGLLFEGRTTAHRIASNGAFLVTSVLLWPFRYLDVVLKNRASAHRLAFGVYAIARKAPGTT